MSSDPKRIVVDGGDMFDGSLDQFKDCFFSNANRETIERWAEDNDYDVEFDPEREPGLQLDEMSATELLAACCDAPIAVFFELRNYLGERHAREMALRNELEKWIGLRKGSGEPLGTETLADWITGEKARFGLLKLYTDPFCDAEARPVFRKKHILIAHLLWELGHFGDAQGFKIERMAAILGAFMEGKIAVKYDKKTTRHYIEEIKKGASNHG